MNRRRGDDAGSSATSFHFCHSQTSVLTCEHNPQVPRSDTAIRYCNQMLLLIIAPTGNISSLTVQCALFKDLFISFTLPSKTSHFQSLQFERWWANHEANRSAASRSIPEGRTIRGD